MIKRMNIILTTSDMISNERLILFYFYFCILTHNNLISVRSCYKHANIDSDDFDGLGANATRRLQTNKRQTYFSR